MDYVKIYKECLKHEYHNDVYEPVIDSIYKLTDIYEMYVSEIRDHNMLNSELSYKRVIEEFMIPLFAFIDKLLKDNNYNDLYDTISFLYDCSVLKFHYIEYLDMLYYPEDKFNTNKNELYNHIWLLCRDSSDKSYPIRISNYITKFNEYRKALLCDKTIVEIVKDGIREFDHYGSKIVAYCYSNNIDVSHLDKMFDCIMLNYKSFKEYIASNYSSERLHTLEDDIIDTIINMCEEVNKVIL